MKRKQSKKKNEKNISHSNWFELKNDIAFVLCLFMVAFLVGFRIIDAYSLSNPFILVVGNLIQI